MIYLEVEPLGRVEVPESDIYEFPGGLPGFNHLRRFAFVQSAEYAPLAWMVSLEEPLLSFVVVDPARFFPAYRPRLAAEDMEVLGLAGHPEAVILAILNVTPDPQLTTANLRGPIILNPATRLGRQAILAGQEYSTRHSLTGAGSASAAPGRRPEGSPVNSQGRRDHVAGTDAQAQSEHHHR